MEIDNKTKYRIHRILFFLLTLVLSAKMTYATDVRTYHDAINALDVNSLPQVNLILADGLLSKGSYIQGKMILADYARRTRGVTVDTFDVKVKYRGSSSMSYEKKSFAIKTIASDGSSMDVNMLGISSDDPWILDAMAKDRLRMRNRLCFDIWNDFSHTPYTTKYGNRNGTKGYYVEVYLNGVYHGLYCLSDKINRKLLDLKKAKEKEGAVTVKGLLYKGNSWGEGADLLGWDNAPMNTDVWNAWELQYPSDYPSEQAWKPLTELIDFLSESNDEEFAKSYKEWLYTDNWIDYFTFINVLYIRDCPFKNTFLSTQDITAGHCYMITPWDLDTSLGEDWEGSYYPDHTPVGFNDCVGGYTRLIHSNVDGFADNVKKRLSSMIEGSFSFLNISDKIKAYHDQLVNSGAWQREYDRWNGNPVPLKANMDDEISYVLNWYEGNLAAIREVWDIPTSGIVGIGCTTSPVSSDIFTLEGQKVNIPYSELPQGLYIVNGHKMLKR